MVKTYRVTRPSRVELSRPPRARKFGMLIDRLIHAEQKAQADYKNAAIKIPAHAPWFREILRDEIDHEKILRQIQPTMGGLAKELHDMSKILGVQSFKDKKQLHSYKLLFGALGTGEETLITEWASKHPSINVARGGKDPSGLYSLLIKIGGRKT